MQLEIPEIYYSKITKDLILECVGRPDATILEIGCNDGSDTLWFSRMFENPTIYCFEPDPRAIGRFRKKVRQQSNINLFEIAISDRNGVITFYQSGGHRDEKQKAKMPEGWDFSGSIRKPKDHLVVHPWVTFEHSIKVKTASLDTWCREHGINIIDFIWMDVQGAEIDVFRGAQNSLSKTRFVYTEYNNRELYEGQASLEQLLMQLGHFRVLIRYPNDVLLWNTKFEFLPSRALTEPR